MHRDTHNQPKVKATLRKDVNNSIEMNKYLADTGKEEWINVNHTLTLSIEEYNQFSEDFKGFITHTKVLGVILVEESDMDRPLPFDDGILDGYTVCQLDAEGNFAAGAIVKHDWGGEGLFVTPEPVLISDDLELDEVDDYDPDEYIRGASVEGSEFWKDSHFTPDVG